MAEGADHRGLTSTATRGLILHKTIVFVGMMGAGKTAVGRTLAQQLGVVFRDSDHEIEEAAQHTIAEIFARDGEPFFRRKETQIIERLLDGRPGVLSTGGGAFLSEYNRRMMSEKGVSVWLDAGLDLLWERVRHKDTRPLLKTPDPKGTLKTLYEARVPVYRLADLTVRSEPGMSLDAMARRVTQALLAERPDVLENPGRPLP
ncbi:shikimate kinase [Sagittula salina]|uniref:Shikimate kinase n=1 Tax=Sagittula salina TaxID=2820268 RepID=A0A940MJP2_9RHOB|nr:shikimate kinase [Sagittula salina]MBP0483040.1 shikimate kinase [Sagittula salina]